MNTYYVDNNISAIEPLQPDPWTLDPVQIDGQDLRITYSTGAHFALRLGMINVEGGGARADFRKSGGVIFAIDAAGNALFDPVNTPRLAAIRLNVHDQLRQRAEERLLIAEVTFVFVTAVANLGRAGGLRF